MIDAFVHGFTIGRDLSLDALQSYHNFLYGLTGAHVVFAHIVIALLIGKASLWVTDYMGKGKSNRRVI